MSSLSLEDLESFHEVANICLFVATLGVAVGVYFEREEFPHDVQQYGWRLVLRGVAFEFFFAVILWQLDTSIGLKQKAIIASLELELAKIKNPRIISREQHQKIVDCLRVGAKGPVYVRPGLIDTDGPPLAKHLEEILKEAGFSVLQWPNEGLALTWSTPGWFLIVRNMKDAPLHAQVIQRCFFAADLPIYGEQDEKHPAEAVSIGIGPRL